MATKPHTIMRDAAVERTDGSQGAGVKEAVVVSVAQFDPGGKARVEGHQEALPHPLQTGNPHLSEQ